MKVNVIIYYLTKNCSEGCSFEDNFKSRSFYPQVDLPVYSKFAKNKNVPSSNAASLHYMFSLKQINNIS